MPHKVEEDWSDSDDEGGGDVETNVLLGVPDGPITDERELADAAVSRIGGRPVRLVLFTVHILYLMRSCSFYVHLYTPLPCPSYIHMQ
jgi:hypothetical protein